MRWPRSLILAAVLAALSLPAFAQQACGPRDKFVSQLEGKYNERLTAMGITSKGAMLEVFAAPEGNWTFLITMPHGLTCVVADGESWENIEPEARPEEGRDGEAGVGIYAPPSDREDRDRVRVHE